MESNRKYAHLNKLVNSYHLVEYLGKGQFGEVYKALDTQNCGEVYAVKIMNKERTQSNPTLKKLFKAELSSMKRLAAQEDNQNCVRLHDFLETSNNFYLVLEYCNQKDLEEYIKQKGCLSEDEAYKFLLQMMAGFRAMHFNDLMHRDFKAANVFLHNGTAKIGDFGFAREVVNQAETVIGTPISSAPEVLSKTPYTKKADLWSLAVVYFHMLEGRLPFMAKNIPTLLKRQQECKLEFLKPISDLSKDFILKCFEYDQNKRLSWAEAYEHPLFHQQDNMLSSQMDFSPIPGSDNIQKSILFYQQDGNGIYDPCRRMGDLENEPQPVPRQVQGQPEQPPLPANPALQEDFDINTVFLRDYLHKYHFLCKSYDNFPHPHQVLLKLIVLVRIKERLQVIIKTLEYKKVVSPQLEMKSLPAFCQTKYAKRTLVSAKANMVINQKEMEVLTKSKEMEVLIKNKKEEVGQLPLLAFREDIVPFKTQSLAYVKSCIFDLPHHLEKLDILDVMLIDHFIMEKSDYLKYNMEKKNLQKPDLQQEVCYKTEILFQQE